MRFKILLFLAVCLSLPAFAQQLVTASLTAAASSCAAGQPSTAAACLFLPIGPQTNTVGATLAGTFSATQQFEASADNGKTWVSVPATPAAGGSTVTSSTGTGTWTISAAGYSFVRIRCSAYSSGSATATLNPSQAVTAGAGGGAASAPWARLTGDLTETQVIAFDGGTVGTPDTGISRLAGGSLAIGNGTQGDASGTVTATYFYVGTNLGFYGVDANTFAFESPWGKELDFYYGNARFYGNNWVGSGGTLAWTSSSTPNAGSPDSGISRLAAGSLAIGNGTQGDFTGSLKLGNEVLIAAAPTVAGSQIGIGSTTAASSNCGSLATACMVINVAGTTRYIPYF